MFLNCIRRQCFVLSDIALLEVKLLLWLCALEEECVHTSIVVLICIRDKCANISVSSTPALALKGLAVLINKIKFSSRIETTM